MPIDKDAVLNNNNGKAQQHTQRPSPTNENSEATALAVLSQTAAGTIRQSIGAMNQLAEKLEDQRDMVTSHAADRVASILDPTSIQAEIAVKTLERLEGKEFLPFEVEAIDLPEAQRYSPQLPPSYASESWSALPSSSTSSGNASGNLTILNGNSKLPIPAGTGFGMPHSNS